MTGSLQVKNGKYYMVLNSTENGKRKQKWISTGLPEKGNKRKAEQMLREKLTEEEKRNPVVCSDMTVADCVRRWLIRMQRRVDEVTYRSYQHTAETHILPYFDENRLKLCDCTVEVLQTYFDEKYRNGRKDGKGGLSSKTMRHHKGILGQALAECVKDGLIPSNPCQYVEMPRRERHEAHFYSAEQLQQLITALNGDPIQPLVKIAALYGLRRSELLGLKWDSIDFENGKNYQNIKVALKRLADNSFWIEEDDDELLFQWINTPRIKKKSGKVIIKISDDVMPYLYNLQEKFTSYELYQILALKGSHSIALYELFKSYLFRKSVKFSIDDIKKYLSLEDKYKEYKEFRRRVIEPAVKEINEYTDLQVEWEPIKKGRTYVGIHFKIRKMGRFGCLSENYKRTGRWCV